MLKVAAVVWIMLGNVMAGLAMLAIVTVPSLADEAGRLIPMLCVGAYLLAIPISYVLARQIAIATQTA